MRRLRSRPVPPHIGLLYDLPGWAFENKCRAIARALTDQFDVTVLGRDTVGQADLDRLDLLVAFNYQDLRQIEDRGIDLPERIAIGSCAHIDVAPHRVATLDRWMNHRACAVFFVSASVRDAVRPHLGAHVPTYLTPNGVDTEFFTPSRAPRRPGRLRVGWTGSTTNLGPIRGVEIITEATHRAGAELYLARREDRWRPRAEMPSFYHSIDVYACASLHEGTPNPVFEAAACGVPCVSTMVGAVPAFVDHGRSGVLVERTPRAFARALRVLRANPALLVEMGREARHQAERWAWPVMAERFREMFIDILGGRPQGTRPPTERVISPSR